MSTHADLVEAAASGEVTKVHSLLEDPLIAASVATDNNAALQAAAANGHLAVVERLLKEKAVRESAAAYSNAALRRAAEEGHLAVVQCLLKEKAVQDNLATGNNQALLWAAAKGHLAVVELLLQEKVTRDNLVADSNAILRGAALNGHLAVVELLLQEKAVQGNLAADDNLALQGAAEQGHLAVVECLLKEKAVRDNLAADNNLALQRAAERGHLAVVECLLKEKAVRDNVAADNHGALRNAINLCELSYAKKYARVMEKRQEYLFTIFRLLQAYKQAKIAFPTDITIEGSSLEEFFNSVTKHHTKLRAYTQTKGPLPPPLFTLIGSYLPSGNPLNTPPELPHSSSNSSPGTPPILLSSGPGTAMTPGTESTPSLNLSLLSSEIGDMFPTQSDEQIIAQLKRVGITAQRSSSSSSPSQPTEKNWELTSHLSKQTLLELIDSEALHDELKKILKDSLQPSSTPPKAVP